jgi:hypothetical protein
VVVSADRAAPAENDARLLLRDESKDSEVAAANVEAGIALTVGLPVSWPVPTMLHGPLYPGGRPLLEIAHQEEPAAGTMLLCDYLGRIGINVVVTRPRERYAIDELLVAYFAPLVRYCRGQGRSQAVNASLRAFGFVRRPHDVLEGVGGPPVIEELLASAGLPSDESGPALRDLESWDYEDGEVDPGVTDALCASLIATASRLRSDGVVGHPALTDLIARDILDFPLQYGSLGTYGTKARIRELLGQTSSLRDLLATRDLAELEKALAGRKGTYL